MAADFADRFYRGLAGGASIETAFNEAEGAAQSARGGVPRDFYNPDLMAAPQSQTLADRWPWMLFFRDGAETAGRWNLPDAADDPLFGLPDLPPGDLPRSPFRNILWFRPEAAAIFFGRGYDICDLYQRVTAPDGAPIVLYYGQSGVGKSSLLAAGLLPRLEQVQSMTYARREQALGLAGTLAAALNLPGTFEGPRQVRAAWLAVEAGKAADTFEADEALRNVLAAPLRPSISLVGHGGWVTDVTWSADESCVLSSSVDGTALIWDARSGEEVVRLQHDEEVHEAKWSADESRVLTRSMHGSARVWDAQSGEELTRLRHDGPVEDVKWTVDESYILTSSRDGTARIWTISLDELKDGACTLTTRNMQFAEWESAMGSTPYRPTCPMSLIPTDVTETTLESLRN